MEQQVEQEARELQNLQKQVAAEHDWTQGGVTGRRKRNARRLRELERLREKLKKDKIALRQRSQKIDMDALDSPNASKIVAEFRGVSKRFYRGDTAIPILHDFSHTLLKGDRLGILGKNGSGKSSFLKLLTGEIEPDSGRIFRSKTIDISYFDQNRSALDPSKTLWETLCPDGGQFVYIGRDEEKREVHVCGYLKRFLFDPKAARDKVGTLSGGQQNRLLLARILARPGNVMILDEPTNDLDMDTLDMLQDMLADYPGTLLVVSHDRDFLDRTVTETLAFEGDAGVHACFGGYSDYARQAKRAIATPRSPLEGEQTNRGRSPQESRGGNHSSFIGQGINAHSTPTTLPDCGQSGNRVLPPEEGAGHSVRVKPLTYGEKLELDKLPARMEQAQAKIEALKSELDDAGLYVRDPERFNRLIKDYDTHKKSLEKMELRWLELEERKT